jgi:hypothetical protein
MNQLAAVAGVSVPGVVAIEEAVFGGAKLASFSNPGPAAFRRRRSSATRTAKPFPTQAPVISAVSIPSHGTENAGLSRREMEA